MNRSTKILKMALDASTASWKDSPDLFQGDVDENNNALFPSSPVRSSISLRNPDWHEDLFPFPHDKENCAISANVSPPASPTSTSSSSTSSTSTSSSSKTVSSSPTISCDDDLDKDFDPQKEKEYKSDHEILDGPSKPKEAAEKQGFKRKRDPTKWARNKKKEQRNSGQKVSPAPNSSREIKERCGDKCKFECRTVTDEERQDLFKKYWGLPGIDKKRYFLSCLMKPIRENEFKRRNQRPP